MGPAYAIDGEGLPLVSAGNWMTHLDHQRKSPVWRHPVKERTRLSATTSAAAGLSDRHFDGTPHRRLLSGRESLTASEDRVAALAAEGLTNREIAQRQFVTVKAVQWHLRNIYRKLDVGSRGDLPAALGLDPRTKHWDGSASDTGATAAQDRRHEPPPSTPLPGTGSADRRRTDHYARMEYFSSTWRVCAGS
ncbi:MAG: helix-turn-helix transcriptional regulator [Solirubrobacteraceae bacterium]